MTKSKKEITRRPDRVFRDLHLSHANIQVRNKARAFAQDALAPIAYRLNTTPESCTSFPVDVFHSMTKAGLYRIPFPADVGGDGLRFPTLATLIVLEEIAYYSPGVASA